MFSLVLDIFVHVCVVFSVCLFVCVYLFYIFVCFCFIFLFMSVLCVCIGMLMMCVCLCLFFICVLCVNLCIVKLLNTQQNRGKIDKLVTYGYTVQYICITFVWCVDLIQILSCTVRRINRLLSTKLLQYQQSTTSVQVLLYCTVQQYSVHVPVLQYLLNLTYF